MIHIDLYDGQRHLSPQHREDRIIECSSLQDLASTNYDEKPAAHHSVSSYLVALGGNAIEYVLIATILAALVIPLFQIVGVGLAEIFTKLGTSL